MSDRTELVIDLKGVQEIDDVVIALQAVILQAKKEKAAGAGTGKVLTDVMTSNVQKLIDAIHGVDKIPKEGKKYPFITMQLLVEMVKNIIKDEEVQG